MLILSAPGLDSIRPEHLADCSGPQIAPMANA